MALTYYYAANKWEGCGHQHTTQKAASKCADKNNLPFVIKRSYKLTFEKVK